MQLAREALDEGVRLLRSLAIHSTVLVQSDGGSDFTGQVFQSACLRYGTWVRCKVSQKGGMGVLERLNRTYKYSYAFRHDWRSLAEVQTALPAFHCWYNRDRRHSALNYCMHPLGYTDWSSKPSLSRLKRFLEQYLASYVKKQGQPYQKLHQVQQGSLFD